MKKNDSIEKQLKNVVAPLLHSPEDAEHLDELLKRVGDYEQHPSDEALLLVILAKDTVLTDVKAYCPGDLAVKKVAAALGQLF